MAAAEISSECNSELTLSSSNSGLSLHQPGGAAAAARPASPRDPLASLARNAAAKEHRLRGRRLLRHCGCACAAEPPNPTAEPPNPTAAPPNPTAEPLAATVAGGSGLGAWLQSALDACEHSPFGAALLAKGCTEQAAWLYNESRREALEQGAVPPPPVPPPPPPPRAVLALLDPRCHQLLFLLWARGAAR